MTSSRRLAQALELDVAFRYLAANQQPNFRTISDFRKEHLKALEGLFVQVLELCREAGLAKLGRVALDGTKVRGNAALEANRTKRQMEAEVQRMLREAEEADRDEDDRLGMETRGDELPEGLSPPGGPGGSPETGTSALGGGRSQGASSSGREDTPARRRRAARRTRRSAVVSQSRQKRSSRTRSGVRTLPIPTAAF